MTCVVYSRERISNCVNMANLKMPEEEPADFISKKVDYMVQAIRGSLGDDGKATFGNLSTDAERFAFLWSQSSTHDVIALEPEFSGKSAENAKTHREKVQKFGTCCYYIIVCQYITEACYVRYSLHVLSL